MHLKNLGNSVNATKSLLSLLNKTNENGKIAKGVFSELQATTSAYSKEVLITSINQKAFTEEQAKTVLAAKGVETFEAQQIITTAGLSAAQKEATTSTLALGTATKGLWATMVAHPFISISAGVGVLIGLYSKWKQVQEENRQAAEDAAKTYADTSKSIDEYAKKYEDLHTALLEAKGNEEETYNIKKQLLNLQTELNDKFGDEYGKLNLVTDAYKDQTDAIKAFNKETAKALLNDISRSEQNKSIDEMTGTKDYNLNVGGTATTTVEGQALQGLIKEYEDQGITSQTSDGMLWVYLNADPTSAEETINNFMTDVSELAKELGDEHIFDEVLDISKSSKDDAKKTISDWGDIYEKTLMGQIALDDDLSAGMEKATQAVQKYNEAVLQSEDSYNDKNVQKTYQDLQKIKGELQNDDEWSKYASVINEVFNQADTKLLDFTHDLSSTDYSKILDTLRGKSDIEAKALIDVNEGNVYKELISLADEYSMSINDVISNLQKMGIVVETVGQETKEIPQSFTKTEMISAINGLSEGFESLDKIMSSVKDKNPFNYALLDDKNFKDTFGDLGESYENFVEKISNSPKDIKGCQSAFNDLVTTWLYSEDVLGGLSDDTAELTTNMLTNMGVTNAQEVVTAALAQRHAEAAWSSRDLANATADEITALANESEATDDAKISFETYIVQKMLAEAAIDTSGDITALANVVNALGLATDAWQKYYAVKSRMAEIADDPNYVGYEENGDKVSKETVLSQYAALADTYQKEYAEELENMAQKATYGGGVKSGKSGSGGSKGSKDTSEEINYIDRLLSQSEKRIQQYKNELEDAFTLKDKYTALDKIVTETESQLKTMDDVYKFYSDKASEKLAQIPEGLRDSVRNGTIDIETLNDEKLANLIKEFWDLDGKADNAKDKIRDLDKSIKDLAKQRVQIKIDVLENKQDKLNFKLDKYKALISAVVSGIEGEIDDVNDYYDRKIDKIQSQIDALETQKKVYQDQLDALNEQNEALEIQKKLEDALYEKRKAENNKNVHIYREDKGDGKSGFVWESDQDAVKDANEQYDEAVFDKKKYDLQTQIDAFDKQISALDETIDKLEKSRDNELDYLNSIKDSWSSIEETAERIASMEMADGFWGDGWFNDIMNGDTSYLDDMTEKFQTTYGIISDNQQEIDRLNELLSTIDGVDNATAMHLANMATGFNTLGTTATTQSGNVNTATTSIPPLTEENRALNEESLLLWGENFTTFGGQACGVADSIAISYESMAARLEAAAERAVRAIKRIKRAERDDDEGYAKGTRNAKPGLHPVAEGNKPEIIIKNSGSAVIADKETYYPFSGGETVLKPQDTKDILSGDNTSPTRLFNGIDMDFLNSFDPQEMMAKYLSNFNMPMFDTSKMIVNNTENKGPSLTIGKIEMHEVNDAEGLTKEICSTYSSRMSQMFYKR